MADQSEKNSNTLAIIAGGGTLPPSVAAIAQQDGRDLHVIAFRGSADRTIERFPHTWINIGELGKLLKTLEQEHCSQLVILGTVRRPNLSELKFDLGALANMSRILSLTIGGDNSMLSNIVDFFEGKGYQVVGAHQVAPELLAAVGEMTCRKPDSDDLRDIRLGFEVVTRLGELDIGQAAVVARNHVLAVEAAEGTDRMLERCKDIRPWGGGFKPRRGVLVKGAKPGQDMRIDLPTIGPRTVQGAAEAGLAGIAVAAGRVLVADRAAVVEAADAAGLFVTGIDADKARSD